METNIVYRIETIYGRGPWYHRTENKCFSILPNYRFGCTDPEDIIGWENVLQDEDIVYNVTERNKLLVCVYLAKNVAPTPEKSLYPQILFCERTAVKLGDLPINEFLQDPNAVKRFTKSPDFSKTNA